jgi:hypothetical protein
MKVSNPILEYAPAPPTYRHLTLEERNGSVRVTFPVFRFWVYILQICCPLTAGAMQLSLCAAAVVFLCFRSHQMPPREVLGDLLWILLIHAMSGSFLFCCGLHEWWKYRHFGRVPRVLTADAKGVSLIWLGFHRMRQRTWTADEITAIRFGVIKGNLNRSRTLGRLSLIRRKGWKKTFLLSSPDENLPLRISQSVALALQRPLKDPDSASNAKCDATQESSA